MQAHEKLGVHNPMTTNYLSLFPRASFLLACIHLFHDLPQPAMWPWKPHGHDPTHHGMQLGTQATPARCWAGLCNKERRLWATAWIPALQKTKWGLFLGGTQGDGTLETQRLNFTEIKLSMIPHAPVGASGNSYSSGTPRDPLPPTTGGDKIIRKA